MRAERGLPALVLAAGVALGGAPGLGAGCAGPEAAPGASRAAAGYGPRTRLRPVEVRRRAARAAFLPLGRVPYDSLSLPLVSPCGRWVATQTGAAPRFETVLAGPGCPVPEATRVEVHALDLEGRAAPPPQPLEHGLLLGRTVDRAGFLVEAPRAGGARWIGYASWTGGPVHWLVADEHVNAFASLGPDGRLAFARRRAGAERFELVVRHGGVEWTWPGPGADPAGATDWLLPTWSGRDDGLFAMSLEDGELELSWMAAADPATARQSRRSLPLCGAATIETAWQALAAGMGRADARRPQREELVFFHPGLGRAAMWRPFESGEADGAGPPVDRLWPQATLAACPLDDGTALLTTADGFVCQGAEGPWDRVRLLEGTHVARETGATGWPYVLLSPGDREVVVTGLVLGE